MPNGFNNRPPIGERLAGNVLSNVSGILSTRQTAKYASGARCILKINDKLVGFAFGISWRISTQVMEVTTIDDYLPYELAPQRVTVDGTLSMLHIPGQSVGVNLWHADLLNFLFQKYITIEVRDSITDQLLFLSNKVIITSRTEDIKVDALANVNLTWKAIGYRDEREADLPKDLDQPKPGGDQVAKANVVPTRHSPNPNLSVGIPVKGGPKITSGSF